MENMLIIGIAGGSGSGKSTITDLLKKKFGDDVTVINHDNYYKAQHEKTYEERTKQNYDAPEAFDTELLAEHLELLRQGFEIDCPVYDYTQHDRSDQVIRIKPSKVLIIDGILVLALKAITLEEIERLPKGRKLANLLRQGFSSKYIASLMNITPKSVEINRYRLRSKLGLSRSDNLIKFIKSI